MARTASGELEELSDGRFAARITIEGRTRKQFVLTTCRTRPEAEARKTVMAEMASRLRRAGLAAETEKLLDMARVAREGRSWDGVKAAVDALCAGGTEEVKASVIPTFKDFADEWTSGRLHKRFPDHVRSKDADDDKSRLENHINDHLGGLRLDQITLSDCDTAMAGLDEGLKSSSRRHYAQTIRRIMALSVYPGRYIAVSPIPRGWLPRQSKARAKGYVYPDEDATMLACTAIALWRRVLWGFIAREGTRGPSEALSFRWRHFDLERGVVRLDENKTDAPRFWPLSPGVARALRKLKEMRKAEPSDLVFVDEDGCQPDETKLAEMLRQDLQTALGAAMRPELLEHSDARIMLRAHDLRASFVAVALALGRSEKWITQRSGHTTSGQLRNYDRAARTFEELHLGDWRPLDEAIPELRSSPVDCPPVEPTAIDSGHLEITIEPDFPIAAMKGLPQDSFKSAAYTIPPRGLSDPAGNPRVMSGAEPSANPRGAAIAAMYEHAGALAAAGDLAGARALHEAIGKMLGDAGGAAVVDLAAKRRGGAS